MALSMENCNAGNSPMLNHGQELGLQLRFACERGRLLDVKKMLAVGAPILRDANGLNALHKAAKYGHAAVVKQLVTSRRFKLNQPDKYGWTALHWASWNGHVSTVSVLVASNSCNVHATDKSGSNALHCAALNGHARVIRVLVPAKCDPNLQRRDGWTPLHLACWNGHYEAVQELVELRCRVNARTEEGMGGLHLAAAKGFGEIAQLLLDSSIAPDMQDKNGNTALHEATKWNHTPMVKIFMESHCRTNMRNNDGDTPMDIARKEGFNEVAAELSGLGSSFTCFDESFGCADLRQLLFNDKSPKLSDSRKSWILDIDETPSKKKTSDNQLSVESNLLSVSWDERIKSAQDEVRAKYESRIAEVEKSYKTKVEMIEKQCSQRLMSLRQGVSKPEGHERSPSAPEPKTFSFFKRLNSITRTESV